MKATAILIVTSILMSLGLITTGAYVTINNILHPQGNLFEGVVIFSLGVLVLLLLMIATTLGKAIQVFTDVYSQQIEIQQTVNDFHSRASKPKTIGDILGNIMPTGDDGISITDLSTGETSFRPIPNNSDIGKKLFEMFSGMNSKQKTSLENMNLEQLQKELADAIKNDEFEKAQEIKDLIKNLGDNEKKD